MKNLNKKKKAKFFYLQEFLKLLGKKPSKIQPREAPDFLSQVMPPPEHLEYLLRNDSVHGRRTDLNLNNVEVSNEENVENLKWSGIDIVIDSTPHLTNYKLLSNHLQNGSEYVVRCSPFKQASENMQTIVLGVNGDKLDLDKYKIISMASCTTNCLAPLVKVVKDYCEKTGNEIIDLDFVTIHAITSDQLTRDSYHKKDLKRGRDSNNIIDSSTGASSQITLLFPELNGKIFGTAYRVPVADGSYLELRVETRAGIDIKKVNEFFEYAAKSEQFTGILSYETEPLVSSDCINDSHTSIYLEKSAEQINPNKIKICALYDNEFAYSCKIVDLIKEIKYFMEKNNSKKIGGQK